MLAQLSSANRSYKQTYAHKLYYTESRFCLNLPINHQEMLSFCKFSPQVQCNTLWQNPQFPSEPRFSISTHLNLLAFPRKIPTGFCLNAIKTHKKGEFSLSEVENSGEFDDGFLDFEDDNEFEEDSDNDIDDDDVFIPLSNMKKWTENKPRGFGEGKVYDTLIEDKLMEEIEQSRIAQLANVNNLKNNPVKPGSKKHASKQDKASGNIQTGYRVRLVNLPKKKNIHRDLQVAFKGVPGLINIVPLVSGNAKTRDPVCRGLAFIEFKHEDEAKKFVQNFSGQSISFGRVQKKITCEMMDSNLPKPARDRPRDESECSQQTVLKSDENLDNGVHKDISLLDSGDTSALSEHEAEEKHLSAKSDNDKESGSSSTSESKLAKEQEAGEESAINSSLPKPGGKLKLKSKTVAASKTRKDKKSKLNIPGSANRLKVRDKALLTGVFSKYGPNATLTVKEQSK